MCSTYNKGKCVVAERFIRTLKNKIFKYMSSISKNIGKLDDMVNKYKNMYHSTIKVKSGDVKSRTYIDFNKKIIKKILNLKMVIM